MNFLKKFMEGKKYGFYVTLALMLLALITGIIWVSTYGGTDEFSAWGFAFLIVGVVLSLVLAILKRERLAADVLGFCVLMGLLFYISAIYMYVSVVLVGIDADTFSSDFILNTTFFAITSVVALVNMFLPQASKKVEAVETKEEKVEEAK